MQKFLIILTLLICIAISLVSCQSQSNTVSPNLVSGTSVGQRTTLGLFHVSFDFKRNSAEITPIRSDQHHPLITDSFSIKFDWLFARADPTTNGVILPMAFTNQSTTTYYDVRVFYTNLLTGENPGSPFGPWMMILRNPDAYAFWEYDQSEPVFEPFIGFEGNNPTNREFIPGFSETIEPTFFLPNAINYPGGDEFRDIIIKIDGLTTPDLNDEPLMTRLVPIPDVMESNSGLIDFWLLVALGEDKEGSAYLDLSGFGLDDNIPMTLVYEFPPPPDTPIYHVYQYTLTNNGLDIPPTDYIVTATTVYTDDPEQNILTECLQVKIIEDEHQVPQPIDAVRSLVNDPENLPIESVHRMSFATSPFLLVSPGTVCEDTYVPVSEEPGPINFRDMLWLFDGETLDFIDEWDLNLNSHYIYDAVQDADNPKRVVVLLHHFLEVGQFVGKARLRVYDDIFKKPEDFRRVIIPPNSHSIEIIGDYIFVVDPPNSIIRRYHDEGPDGNIQLDGTYNDFDGIPYDIELGSDDLLYVLREGDDNRPIIKISWPETGPPKTVEEWDLQMTNGVDINIRKPHGLGLDSENNVYITDRFTCRILVFRDNGEMLLSFGNTGAVDGTFTGPSDVVIRDDGMIYVSDIENKATDLFKTPPSPSGGDPRIGSATSSIQLFTPIK